MIFFKIYNFGRVSFFEVRIGRFGSCLGWGCGIFREVRVALCWSVVVSYRWLFKLN